MYDVVVWAAVSTLEQAEKASIGHQLKLADEWIAKNNARKVAELIVPGHTREYIFLHEIMRDVPAYAQLVEMVAGTKSMPGKRFNLLLAYDHTRLARGEALLAQIREFLGENGIQIAYTAQFMPLVPPDEFDYKQAFSIKALSAFQGISTSQEMGTLRARAKFGKETKADRGVCMTPSAPYGFVKVRKGVLGPVESEIAVIRRMYELYLDEGLGLRSVARRINSEGHRSRDGNLWTSDTVRKVILNQALIGKIAYGKTRVVRVPSGDGLQMVTKRIPGKPIVRDSHEPVISEERYQHLLDEMKRRFSMRRGADVGSPNVYVLSGILVCGYCGGPMCAAGTRIYRDGQVGYSYQCYKHMRLKTCRSNYGISRRLEVQAESILREVAKAADLPAAVDEYLGEHDPDSALDETEARLKALEERQRRLQDGYLDGAISLPSFRQSQIEIERQISQSRASKASLEEVQRRTVRKAALIAKLLELLDGDAPLEELVTRQKLKLIYREFFESLTVRGGVIVSWKLRE